MLVMLFKLIGLTSLSLFLSLSLWHALLFLLLRLNLICYSMTRYPISIKAHSIFCCVHFARTVGTLSCGVYRPFSKYEPVYSSLTQLGQLIIRIHTSKTEIKLETMKTSGAE